MTRKKTLVDTNSDNTHSTDTLINLLRQIVNQNEQIILLLTKLKERFV